MICHTEFPEDVIEEAKKYGDKIDGKEITK